MSKKDRLDGEFRYVLRRSKGLNDAERALLAFLGSYAYGCLLEYDKICEMLCWSRSKLHRTIKKLVSKKLVTKKYRLYKKVTLKIASAADQKRFVDIHDVSPMTHHDVSQSPPMMCHQWPHDVSPMTHPILERDLERNKRGVFNEKRGAISVDNSNLPRRPGDVMRLVKKALVKN